MIDLSQDRYWTKFNPIASLLILIGCVLIGFMAIGPLLGLLIAIPFFDGDIEGLMMLNNLGNPSLKVPLYILQGTSTVVGFLVVPLLYAYLFMGFEYKEILNRSMPSPLMSALVIVIVFVFMGFNSVFIEWNANASMPDWLSGFESWAKNIEASAQELTEFLTAFDNSGQFYLALFVIAVLPAIGEELVFRGLIQNHLLVITKNIHVAIWAAAFIFSFFHLQFFGFVPRMLLGALFGYLYFWSGKLSYAVVAHFANNGITLLFIYLHQKGALNFDIENTNSLSLDTIIFSMLLTGGLMFIFWRFFRKNHLNPTND